MSSEVRHSDKPRRGPGRPRKYPDGRRMAIKLRVPAYAHSAVQAQAERWGINMGDLVAFYVITGWGRAHPQAPLPMPEYLQLAWNTGVASAEPMFPIPAPKATELTSQLPFLVRLPEPVRMAINAEADRTEQAMAWLGAFYLLHGWNTKNDDQLPIPPHLIEAWDEVRATPARPRQEAMLA